MSQSNFSGSHIFETMELVGDIVVQAIWKYSRLSLSRIPRDSLKYFEISVVRHIRFAELRKK